MTAAACDAAGWEYRRSGDLDPVLAANMRWLSRYRHRRCLVPEIAVMLAEASRWEAHWQRLADEHGTIVAYYTLRTHVMSRREAVAREVNEETGLLVERIGPPGRSPGRGLAPHCPAGPASRAVIGPSSR